MCGRPAATDVWPVAQATKTVTWECRHERRLLVASSCRSTCPSHQARVRRSRRLDLAEASHGDSSDPPRQEASHPRSITTVVRQSPEAHRRTSPGRNEANAALAETPEKEEKEGFSTIRDGSIEARGRPGVRFMTLAQSKTGNAGGPDSSGSILYLAPGRWLIRHSERARKGNGCPHEADRPSEDCFRSDGGSRGSVLGATPRSTTCATILGWFSPFVLTESAAHLARRSSHRRYH